MRTKIAIRSLLLTLVVLIFSHAAFAQFGISVTFGPPSLPVYEQPLCPEDGYLWTPGYWAWDPDFGYYWVPGTWVLAPQVGYLWTPGYWGWNNNAFIFNQGYWGPQVGYYGGINYGFGYGGAGYEGGRWDGGHFAYNTYVNRVNTTIIHNTYNTTITNVTVNHVSYNGGTGGVEARPTPQQEAFANQRHIGPIAAQTQHVQAARTNPELRATTNHGMPPIAATAKPADFKTGAVAARQAGGEYKAPPANAARATAPAASHATELQPHTLTPPNTGNAATDKKYQQQQDKLAAKQAQDHQKLQQQQENEHQQAAAKNYNDAQKQQMEQRHAQQTQQVEQKHATQQTQLEQRQAPHQTESRPPSPPPSGEKSH
jgi:WXXGXW repeat (2 copies)